MRPPNPLHPSLSGAARMLRGAYPGGIPEAAYMPLLALLYAHFSDRNLADLIADVTGKDAARVLNELYVAASTPPPAAAIAAQKAVLEPHGWTAISTAD